MLSEDILKVRYPYVNTMRLLRNQISRYLKKKFLAEYSAAKTEHTDYKNAVVDWEKRYGIKAEPDSIKLLLNEKLNEYLHEIDEECYERMELLIRQMKEREDVTEQLKRIIR